MVQRDIITFFSEKIANELHDWIEKRPHVIQSPNVSGSMIVQFNGTLVKKHNHLPQISVQELYNDLLLSASQCGFSCEINEDGKIYIGYSSLRKYMPRHIKPMSNINNITFGCETCISSMLLQSDFKKIS